LVPSLIAASNVFWKISTALFSETRAVTVTHTNRFRDSIVKSIEPHLG